MNYIINYKNVDLNRREFTVLKNVNLQVSEGEFIYIIGKVGSGKSTLFKSMYRELAVSEADEVSVLDYDLLTIRKKDVPMLRRRIGIVFQDFQLLTDRSVYDNLLFVLKATGWKDKQEIDERINEVLELVGMQRKSYKMPHELSGGEQQRIVIARALLNRPALILADEPTGNLDNETGKQIVSLLHDISENGTAVIIATHNTSLIGEFPGRVFTCENKCLVEEAKTTSAQ